MFNQTERDYLINVLEDAKMHPAIGQTYLIDRLIDALKFEKETLENQCEFCERAGPRISEREARARSQMVRDVHRAKRALFGGDRERINQAFFKHHWPHILKHLENTGFEMPEGE